MMTKTQNITTTEPQAKAIRELDARELEVVSGGLRGRRWYEVPPPHM